MNTVIYNLKAKTRQVMTKWAVDPNAHRIDAKLGISKQIIEDIDSGQKYLKITHEEFIPVSNSWVAKLQDKYIRK